MFRPNRSYEFLKKYINYLISNQHQRFNFKTILFTVQKQNKYYIFSIQYFYQYLYILIRFKENMKTSVKQKQISSNQSNLKQKNPVASVKSNMLVTRPLTSIRSSSRLQKFQANQLKDSDSTTNKKSDGPSLAQNIHEYKQDGVINSIRVSKQNLNDTKKESNLFQSKEISFTQSHQFLKNQEKNTNFMLKNPQKTSNPLEKNKLYQLAKQNINANTRKTTSICEQIQPIQLKSSKSAEFLKSKQFQFQTPTFENIHAIKINETGRPSSKVEKMKLRDYLFMTNITTEAAVNRKRLQRSSIQSKVEHVKPALQNCTTQEKIQLKNSSLPHKYTLPNKDMAAILSRDILSEIAKLKNKLNRIESWSSSVEQSQVKQIGPYYIVRRDLHSMNANFDDIIKKFTSVQRSAQASNNVQDINQSIALAKIVNHNLQFTTI